MNDHWKVLYQNRVFGADLIFKMAAVAGQSLTLNPMGNAFEDLLLGND